MQKTRQENIQDCFETFHKVVHDFRGGHHSRFEQHRFGGSPIRIMFLISHRPEGLTVKDIAEKLGITSGAVTQIVDELAAKGLVARTEDPNDRRVIRVARADRTRNLFRGLRAKFFHRIEPMFDNLTDEEIRTLRDLIAKLGSAKINEDRETN
ncbi:MAG TPA: MarR family transcriptional regulator [Candidatus Saccharimonadales bacterium]|nr:MarR family transcriptional regulator [Candidatus Saccharimonadales bacterium]